jgi:hypothetical protein
MRSVRRRSIEGVLVAIVATATVVGCTAGLDGTPYGAAADSTGKPAKAESSPLDAGGHAPHWSSNSSASDSDSETSDGGTYALPDSGLASGAADAAAAVVATSSTPNCSGSSLSCEDCCFAAIPGSKALDNQIGAELDDCLNANQCIDQGCYDFCNNQAMDDQCSAQPTLCHQIDNCMNANNCP